jgi:hypothetical protein
MLASTVQFSRYGRRSNVYLRVHHLVSFEALDAEPSSTITALKAGPFGPLPQDSTVCLRSHHERETTFHPTEAGVLVADAR